MPQFEDPDVARRRLSMKSAGLKRITPRALPALQPHAVRNEKLERFPGGISRVRKAFGFELDESGMVKIATPEKALVDIFYFSPTRSRLFKKLPEIEFPKRFSWQKAFALAKKIKSPARRTFVEKALLSLRNKS